MSLDSMFQAAVRKPVKFKTKKKQPALTEQEVLRRRAENMRRSPTGQVLETYQGPDTFGGAVYDAFGRVMGGLRGLTGGDEHTAANARFEAEDQLRGIGEFLLGPEELQRAARSVKLGNAGGGDYATLGLAALPFVPKPVKKVARLAVSKAGSAAAKAVPKAARTFMTEARPLVDDAADFIEGKFSVRPPAAAPQQPRLTTSYAVPRRVEGPAPRQALPAPGPGLPPLASKPRGGQWWINKEIEGVNSSPEAVASQQAGDLGYRFLEWQPDDDYGLISLQVPDIPKEQFAVQDWLSRSLAKYYKNDFGSPEDPLRALAERGLHYDPDMTPEKWKATVDSYLLEDPVQSILFPPNREGGMPGAGSDLRGNALSQMPWLAKAPVTDNVYGITGGGLDLEHFADEFYNALHPEVSGIPADLAVRPEMLERMSFPQAVERVGRINQFRAKQAEQAALDAQNNPVTHVFKEYTENNPKGLRWVEMAPPKSEGPANYDVEEELRKALKYEGDTMGHCVGGYCPDVMSGRSRIFSLRDAKGEPHVTIETSPLRGRALTPDDHDRLFDQAMAEIEALNIADPESEHARIVQRKNELVEALRAQRAAAQVPEDIIQIKGKQNRAPKDEYLPFVQDFVKSQKWGNVGDLGNTGLVRLPDGRYITQQQYEEGANKAFGPGAAELLRNSRMYSQEWWDRNWPEAAPHFEGYAIGGKVDADRCFCRHPLSVKGKK